MPPPLPAPGGIRAGPPPLAPSIPLAAPVGPMVGTVPLAEPVRATPPEIAPDHNLAFHSEADGLVSPRAKRGKRPIKRSKIFVFLGLFFFSLLVLALGARLLWVAYARDRDQDQTVQRAQGNFHFKRPPSAWTMDGQVRSRMGLKIAMSRSNPRSHMGLFYRDYEKRAPTEAEMMDEALRRLRAFFQPVNYQDPYLPENKREQPAKLGGQEAVVVEFAGSDPDNVEMRGEAYLMTARGYAYWFFTWGPADEQELLQEGWAELRQHFRLLNNREGWRPHPREMETFDGTKFAYRLDYAKDLWEKEPNPAVFEGESPTKGVEVELLLRAFKPTENEETGRKTVIKHAGKAVTAVVLMLDKPKGAGGADKAARAYLKEKKEREGLNVEIALDKKLGADVGGLVGQLSRLKITLDKEKEMSGLLGVVDRPEGLFVVYCECPYDDRAYWDREFQLLVESVRPRAKRPKKR